MTKSVSVPLLFVVIVERVGAVRRRAFGLRPVPPLSSRPFGFNPLYL